mgnify:CR=1 FL=1
MTSPTIARDTLIDALRTSWLASATTVNIELQFDNVRDDTPTGQDSEGRPLPFGRITMRHVGGDQETLGNVGARRFGSGGTVTVQIFTAPGDGHALSDVIAAEVRAAMQALRSPNGVWLNEISPPIEIGRTGTWFQVNVAASFSYEEVA